MPDCTYIKTYTGIVVHYFAKTSKVMNAVTITQITPTELEILIEKAVSKTLAALEREPAPDPERWYDIKELAEYLPDKPAVPTIYGYVHRRTIPYHKNSKKLYFLKSEIDAWLRSGRQLTNTEAEAAAVRILKRRG
jgi:predicted DNA-binding transcriptional regulator AlpA